MLVEDYAPKTPACPADGRAAARKTIRNGIPYRKKATTKAAALTGLTLKPPAHSSSRTSRVHTARYWPTNCIRRGKIPAIAPTTPNSKIFAPTDTRAAMNRPVLASMTASGWVGHRSKTRSYTKSSREKPDPAPTAPGGQVAQRTSGPTRPLAANIKTDLMSKRIHWAAPGNCKKSLRGALLGSAPLSSPHSSRQFRTKPVHWLVVRW
jgi:hypothetical protein